VAGRGRDDDLLRAGGQVRDGVSGLGRRYGDEPAGDNAVLHGANLQDSPRLMPDAWSSAAGGGLRDESRSDEVSDIDVLESVLSKDADLLAGVNDHNLRAPTPCPDFDVATLVNHIVGWLQTFAAAANGRTFDGDPGSFESNSPVDDFRAISADLVAGWRKYGTDRTLPSIAGGDGTPAQQNLSMAIMEYTAHGWDLAKGTGQQIPFTDEELETALALGVETLPDQFRGEGMPFGPRVDVPADAPAADRFAAFMGRTP